ncbi:hypothetical protein ACJX0J_032769, partial [Zea mays]
MNLLAHIKVNIDIILTKQQYNILIIFNYLLMAKDFAVNWRSIKYYIYTHGFYSILSLWTECGQVGNLLIPRIWAGIEGVYGI